MMTYEDYRQQWLIQHPHSQPVLETAALTPRWLRNSIAAVWVCAAIVSGAHTVPTMAKTIPGDLHDFVALLSFVMVEGAMFVAMYMRALNRGRALLWSLIALTTIVAIAGNLYSTFETLKPQGVVAIVGLLVGIAAPLVTLMGGELFATLQAVDDRRQRQAKETYEQALKDLDARILTAYHKANKPLVIESTVNPVKTVNFTPGLRRRASPKLDKTVRWLQANKDQASEDTRKLAEIIGVSHTLVAQAQQIVRGQNGHTQEVE